MKDPHGNRRILLVDDTPSIHDDFRKILCGEPQPEDLGDMESLLFGTVSGARARFELDGALQGREGAELVARALQEGRPYAVAFIDMRMPPGWDGVETIEAIWRIDPRLQVVICTAYSDYPWDDVLARLDADDRLLVIKKPFDMIEVSQLAQSLTAKWSLARQADMRIGDLEHAVQERTHELENACRAAEAADRAKSDFLANMSHELRTPMNGVLGMAHLVMKTDLTQRQRDYIAKLQSAGQQLMNLINDMMVFSTAQAAPAAPARTAFTLHEAMDAALAPWREKARAKQLALSLDLAPQLPSRVAGDPLRLQQVIGNYVSNAVKFTASGSVAVSVRAAECEDGQVNFCFRVSDTGPGIDAQQAARLFQAFSQGDTSPTRAFSGAGLGLAACKRLAAQMGGEVGMESEPGQGSSFWLRIPLEAPSQGACQ